ncbi:TetR/AcrR family transcriptional regulator [Saccharopolyspora phatthalungensis]|uniref:AcrR family transcriptional regulator n=1 Tax=Saccharopolyspora phatthalungensis TaxID=664693 RepID=A0A840QF74_9PSEU|nr:TetR/AcrR family transcriptional regulator [Saccharopolyspora phatthalungensis]MBB5157135.1 AcrR family transcriptional regulator [Saccharopolyspora phatthalungensis]
MARGRRPTEEVRRDVLAAAGELLLAEGVRGFTVEEVARRSGASKMTIYKLWPSKGTLALEGYFTTVESALEFPDTGDVEADLRHQLHAFVSLLTATKAGPTMAELIGLAQTDPELRAAFLRTYSSPRRKLAVQRMEKALAEGQLRDGLDPESVVDQLWGACYHRLLIPDLPIDHAFADTLIDNLFNGINRPVSRRRPGASRPR